MLTPAVFAVLLLAAAAMADDVKSTTSTTTATTPLAPSADSDGDIVVWRYGEQRPPNWPPGNFRRPYPDIVDPGFAPDYYKRFRVPQVPNSQSGKPHPEFKLVHVNLSEILSEDQSPENDTSQTSETSSSKNGTLEVQDVPGAVTEPIRVRRQATATPAQGPSRTSDASPLNGLFDLTNLPSRIFERLPSGIIDPGFAPNAFDRFLQGLRNNQQQQQQGQQVPATQAPRLYPDLEGEKLNPGAPAAGGQHGQAGTQRPLLGIIDQNAFDKLMQGLRNLQPQQQGQQATRAEVEGTNLDARTLANAGQNTQGGSQRPLLGIIDQNAFDKFMQGLRNLQPQQQGQQATRAEVESTNLNARTLANAGQNTQGSSQRLPEAAREMLQGLGQMGSDILDRLNVYRNENAFAEFLQNMHQPAASRDIFTNLFRREPSTS
uniref:Putative conserved secreted protein n=1 Tax=Ixodes scapularis TaxID=6945 RepID=A0A4D5S5W9_IXOSC